MYYIGLDVGGTNIKAGLVSEDGKIIKRDMCPTGAKRHPDEIAKDMAKLVKSVAAGIDKNEISSIGIGIPGAIDPKEGVVLETANINFDKYPLGKVLKEECGINVFLGNDGNCAALGEYINLTEPVDNMVMITLGTGVGGGLIINGKLYTGKNGQAGEVGYIMLKDGGEDCPGGRKGVWEAYASVTALIRQTREYVLLHPESKIAKACPNIDDISGKTAFTLAAGGDIDAKAVVDKWIYYVASGIVDMIDIFQPELLLIGGAISREGDRLLDPIKEIVNRDAYYISGERTKIRIASLGNDAGLIGAAFLGKN